MLFVVVFGDNCFSRVRDVFLVGLSFRCLSSCLVCSCSVVFLCVFLFNVFSWLRFLFGLVFSGRFCLSFGGSFTCLFVFLLYLVLLGCSFM